MTYENEKKNTKYNTMKNALALNAAKVLLSIFHMHPKPNQEKSLEYRVRNNS